MNILKPFGLGILCAVVTAVAMPTLTPEWILTNPTMKGFSIF